MENPLPLREQIIGFASGMCAGLADVRVVVGRDGGIVEVVIEEYNVMWTCTAPSMSISLSLSGDQAVRVGSPRNLQH